jgi:hypothetical protein
MNGRYYVEMLASHKFFAFQTRFGASCRELIATLKVSCLGRLLAELAVNSWEILHSPELVSRCQYITTILALGRHLVNAR